MLTGRQALGSIEQALAEARREIQTTNAHISQVNEALAALHQDEVEAHKALAGIRLAMIERDSIVRGLTEAEELAQNLLDQRSGNLAELQREIDQQDQHLQALEQEREAQAAEVEKAAAMVDDAVNATQERLSNDPKHAERVEAAQAAEAVAGRAQRKAELAEEDRDEKGKPYEADPLFMYLWRRGYGTARYRAFPLIRYLDRKVAELCDFEGARANYHMLLEIPKRLNEHLERVRAIADREASNLVDFENAALADDGVDDLRIRLSQEEQKLEAIEGKVDKAQAVIKDLLERETRFSSGEDEAYKKAIQVLVSSYQQESTRHLYRAARRTPTPEDDLIVDKLEDLSESEDELEAEILRHKAVLRSQEKRLSELDRVRHDFRRNRFDSGTSEFANGGMVAVLLSEFLRGALTSGDFWNGLRRQQRFRRRRSNPTFGSGSLGRRSGGSIFGKGSPWGSGGSGSSWGSGGGGFGGRRGGGGFRTGGGF